MISVENLSKVYGNGKGVFDVNFTVSEGEVFGFLGPNGAGKTTTIRVLLGFTTPRRENVQSMAWIAAPRRPRFKGHLVMCQGR